MRLAEQHRRDVRALMERNKFGPLDLSKRAAVNRRHLYRFLNRGINVSCDWLDRLYAVLRKVDRKRKEQLANEQITEKPARRIARSRS